MLSSAEDLFQNALKRNVEQELHDDKYSRVWDLKTNYITDLKEWKEINKSAEPIVIDSSDDDFE